MRGFDAFFSGCGEDVGVGKTGQHGSKVCIKSFDEGFGIHIVATSRADRVYVVGAVVGCFVNVRNVFGVGEVIIARADLFLLIATAEIIVDIDGFKWMIQSTDYVEPNQVIGIYIEPDAIHIMHRSEYSGQFGDYSSFSDELDKLSDVNGEEE